MLDWQELFLKRKTMRENYFRTENPETVRKNLLQELLSNIRECPFEDMRDLVDFAFHPTGELNEKSFGNNPFFRALLAISDQLYIYDEFIQEFGLLVNKNVNLILPASKRKRTFRHRTSNLELLHKELIQKQNELESSDIFKKISSNLRKKEMLEISPLKALLYNLIDDTRSLSELLDLFNQASNLGIKNNKKISKNYTNQLLREMEEDGIIKLDINDMSSIVIKLI